MSQYTIRTARETGGRSEDDLRINEGRWPAVVLEDAMAVRYFDKLYEYFPDFQFVLYDGNQAVAAACSVPVVWDLDDDHLPDEGWDWALESGVLGAERGTTFTTLSAIGIAVEKSLLGTGVSKHALAAMKSLAVKHGMNALIAPVRPTLKSRYPLIPMERYARWTRKDGAPFDPWLRTHWRAGARMVKVAHRAMMTSGTVAKWEAWTGMEFPESGEYTVPDALNPVSVDVEHDTITYIEPNVWMHHPIP